MAKKQDDQVVTARLNKIYGPKGEDSSLDPVLAKLQQRTLERNC
jgi:copper chaperone CopZ